MNGGLSTANNYSDPFKCLRLQALKRLVPKRNYSNVCDLGCGDGYFINLIKEEFPKAKIFGLEKDYKKITTARSLNPLQNFVLANVCYLPLRSRSMDLVLLLEVIEHLQDRDTGFLLREIRRILEPEGIFIISTPNTCSLSSLSAKLVYPLLGLKYQAFDKTHVNLYWPHKLLQKLRHNSFKILSVNGFWLLPVGLSQPSILRIIKPLFPKFFLRTVTCTSLVGLAFDTIIICNKG